jgi:signal transduction histidine kinase
MSSFSGQVGGMDADPKVNEQTALYRVSSVDGHDGDTQRVIKDVLGAVGNVVNCETPIVAVHDSERDMLAVFSADRMTGEFVSMTEPSILRRIFQTGRGEVVNDVVADPDHHSGLSVRMGSRQLIASPLDVGGRRLGVVGAVNSTRGSFTENDLRLLNVTADRAALAIENTQLKSTVHRQGQELEGLHRLSRLFSSGESVDYVAAESVRIVSDLVDCSQVALLLYEPEFNELIAHLEAIGMDEGQVGKLRIPLDRPSLIATVFRTDAPMYSNDAVNDMWVDEDLRDLLHLSNVLVSPLAASGEPMGVLLAANIQKDEFDEADVRFTTLLGARIASVIESSRARQTERQLVHRLREADQTKSEFVSMLAHELKGPMTTVKGFGEILQRQWNQLSDEKRTETLQIMSKEIGRLSRLVTDLLDLSRMEAGTLRYDIAPSSLQEIVHNILQVHPSVRAQHEIVNEVPDDLPRVRADADRVRQVLLNLLTNATRHSPEGTDIRVTAEVIEDREEKAIVIGVSDQGIGISTEDRNRVFSKFATLPKPGWVKKGTGLGLYITKGIVEAHGGRLWVDSEPGRGSTFFFTLQPAGEDD